MRGGVDGWRELAARRRARRQSDERDEDGGESEADSEPAPERGYEFDGGQIRRACSGPRWVAARGQAPARPQGDGRRQRPFRGRGRIGYGDAAERLEQDLDALRA
jgi:hypothetical protein